MQTIELLPEPVQSKTYSVHIREKPSYNLRHIDGSNRDFTEPNTRGATGRGAFTKKQPNMLRNGGLGMHELWENPPQVEHDSAVPARTPT